MRLKHSDADHIVDIVRKHTMVCDDGVRFTAQSVVRAMRNNVMGDMVECGTWRGGCGVAMLLAQRMALGHVERKVHFLVSFCGLPPVDPRRDGPGATEWQSSTTDNCAAGRWELEELLSRLHFKHTEYAIWEGWFSETLPLMLDSTNQSIAVLRLDGDWHSSTSECLKYLMPRVRNRGTVIVDDYYAWAGCTRAVHEWLVANDAPYRIKSLPKNTGAYFIKEKVE
jgi:O-methyltransferase